MDLKQRKRIKNKLPGFVEGFDTLQKFDLDDPKLIGMDSGGLNPLPVDTSGGKTQPSSAAGIGPWFALGEWVGSGIGAGINSIQKKDDIIQDAGTQQDTINGISYTRGNDIDVNKSMKSYKRDMGMSFLTNPFKGFTMLFGKKKQKRELERAKQQQMRTNQYNQSIAGSEYLKNEFYSKYGDVDGQMLYKNGKDFSQTSFGRLPIPANSKTEGGEIIYNSENQTADVVPGNANGDRHLSSILPSDTIITNKYGLADKARFAAQALKSINRNKNNRGIVGKQTDNLMKEQALQVLDSVAAEQRLLRNSGALPYAKPGKYWPGREGRFPSNWWIDGLGAVTGTGKFIYDVFQKPKVANTYAQNPYSKYALNKLSSLRIDPYPIINEMYDQDRRNVYAINRAGGLSGAQKAFANIANGISTQKNIAQLYADIQKQNNAYAANAANAMINAGQADRQARMNANQWDLDYYSKSHGAKHQMLEQDLYNILSALQQGYANSFNRYMFNRRMNRYSTEKP